MPGLKKDVASNPAGSFATSAVAYGRKPADAYFYLNNPNAPNVNITSTTLGVETTNYSKTGSYYSKYTPPQPQ